MDVGLKALRKPGESKEVSADMRKDPPLAKARIKRKSEGASDPVAAANTTHDWGPSFRKSAIPSLAAT